MSQQDKILSDAVARVEERSDALAALYGIQGIPELVNIAVTLDGVFDVIHQCSEEEYEDTVAVMCKHGMLNVMRNAFALAGVPEDKNAALAKDIQGVINERRLAQDRIQALYDSGEIE